LLFELLSLLKVNFHESLHVGVNLNLVWLNKVAFMLNNKVGAENVTKKVGDGSKTLFWHESWLGDEVLKNCFSRLFNLALEKSVFVADMVLGIGVE